MSAFLGAQQAASDGGRWTRRPPSRAEGGPVPPKGKHAAHLVIMIGVMKHRPGAISEKAAKKRGLHAA
jgi:hypothetical protein